MSLAANYLDQHNYPGGSNLHSPANSRQNLGNHGLTQGSVRVAANLMQAALPKISPQIFEKHQSPLSLVKPVSQFMSPRSISQISNLSKMFGADNEPMPRVRDTLNKSNRRIIVDSANKFPMASSSVGFSLNGQMLGGGGKQSKSKYPLVNLLIEQGKLDHHKLESITDAYLNMNIKSPFKLLKEIDHSETNLDEHIGMQVGMHTIYNAKHA